MVTGNVTSLERPASQTIAIKMGGGIINDARLLRASAGGIAELVERGYAPVVVHGGGAQISKRLAGEPQFINGIRVTPPELMGAVAETLGIINRVSVGCFVGAGVNAEGLPTAFEADYLDRETYGEVGKVTAVNTGRILGLIEQGKVPVVSCLGRLAASRGYLNINGDDAAAALVTALAPMKEYVSLTPTGGVNDASGLRIPLITAELAASLSASGVLEGGMRKKVDEALVLINNQTVERIVIAHPDDLVSALLTPQDYGTTITR